MRVRGRAAGVAALSFVVVGVGTASGAVEASPRAVMSEPTSAQVDAAENFRRQLHLRSDAEFITALHGRLAAGDQAVTSRYGMAMTESEAGELQGRREAMEDLQRAINPEDPGEVARVTGGTFMDNSTGRATLLVIASGKDLGTRVVARSRSGRVAVRTVDHSQAEIIAWQAELADATLALRQRGVDVAEIAVGVVANALEVTVRSDAATARQRLGEEFPDMSLIIKHGDVVPSYAGEKMYQGDTAPVRGGQHIVNFTKNAWCTSNQVGFKYEGSGVRYYMLTAGHCVAVGDGVTQAGREGFNEFWYQVGNASGTSYKNGAYADAGVVPLYKQADRVESMDVVYEFLDERVVRT